MAILTQVHVGIAQHEHAKREYRTAADYFETQKKILVQIEAAREADSVNEQSVIREQMNTLVAEVKYDIAFADIENTYAGLLGSIGIDPVPYDANNDSLESLSEALEKHFESMNKGGVDVSLRVDMLPELNLNSGGDYSRNNILFNNDWLNYNERVNEDLLNSD